MPALRITVEADDLLGLAVPMMELNGAARQAASSSWREDDVEYILHMPFGGWLCI
jgi:hypothetical protein